MSFNAFIPEKGVQYIIKLGDELIRNRLKCLWFVEFVHSDEVGFPGLRRLSLQVHLDLGLLGLLLQFFVPLDSFEEVLSALGVRHVFNADIDLLGDDAVAHSLVDHNGDRVLRYVEDAARLAVVELIRHALLESAIALDVDDVPAFVDFHISGQVFDAMLLEATREHVPRPAPIALRVGHPCREIGGSVDRQSSDKQSLLLTDVCIAVMAKGKGNDFFTAQTDSTYGANIDDVTQEIDCEVVMRVMTTILGHNPWLIRHQRQTSCKEVSVRCLLYRYQRTSLGADH